jgi:prepilin-type N-terminal cleavage/methylation domain-containing protein
MSMFETIMKIHAPRPERNFGFTLIELMIVVAIIGILSAIAAPLLSSHQLRAKSSEGKTNLGAIRVVEETLFSEHGAYVPANAEPTLIPGASPSAFDSVNSDYALIGWAPEGRVYFSYAVAVSPDGSGYTADAAADIDGDGVVQIWGYAKPSASETLTAGGLGCDPTQLAPEVVGSCLTDRSIY